MRSVQQQLSILLFLLALISPASALADEAGKEAYYESAQLRYQRGEFAAAAIQLKNALQENPNNLSARVLLGECHLSLGDAASAVKEFQLARKMGADESLLLLPLGNALLALRKHQQILSEVQYSDPAKKPEADILLIRAQAHLQLGEIEQGERLFTNARLLAPGITEPLLGLARIELAKSRPEMAEALIDEALLINPKDAETLFMKGERYRLRIQDDEALDFYSRALQIEPGHIRARLARSRTLMDLDRDADALQDIEYVLDKSPNEPEVLYLKARYHSRTGDPQVTKDSLQAAADSITRLKPEFLLNDPTNSLLGGVVNFALGNLPQARRHLSRYLELKPRNTSARKLYGRVLIKLGEPGEAVSVLYPASRATPDDPELLSMLGEALMLGHRYVEAMGHLERAVELAPDTGVYRTKLAVSRLAIGDSNAAYDELSAALARGNPSVKTGILMVMMQLREEKNDAANETIGKLLEQSPTNPVYHNLAGLVGLAKGDYDLARARFEKAITYYPYLTPAHINLASLDIRDGNLVGARSHYEKILDYQPETTQALLGLANIAVSQNEMRAGMDFLEKIQAFNPNHIESQYQLVMLYLHQGMKENAESLATKLVSENPESAQALIAQAEVEITLGKNKAAQATLGHAVRYAGFDTDQVFHIAERQIFLRDYPNARNTLTKLTLDNPDSFRAHLALVQVEMMVGDYDVASVHAKDISTRFPNSSAGNRLMGDVLMQKGKPEEALEKFATALAQQPSASIAVRYYQTLGMVKGRTKSLKFLEDWNDNHPGEAVVERALAGAYLDNGDISTAIEHHQRLLKSSPNDSHLINNLAWAYFLSGDARAMEFAERAHKLNPEHSPTLDTLGWIHVKQGDATQGLKYLREASIRSSKDPTIRYHLAAALVELGRTEEAKKHLEVALSSAERFKEIQDAQDLMAQISKGS